MLAAQWTSIKNLPIAFGTRMIMQVREKINEQRHWELYLVAYGNMDKDTYKTFDEFYNTKKPKISKKSAAEIVADAKRIKESLGK